MYEYVMMPTGSVRPDFVCVNVCVEVEYLLKKICGVLSVELNSVEVEEFCTQQCEGLSVWRFLELVDQGVLGHGLETHRLSSAIEDVYREICGNVLKEVHTHTHITQLHKFRHTLRVYVCMYEFGH